MSGFVLGIYSLYLFAVAISGNSESLIEDVKTDAGDYFPWLIGIFVLVVLYEYQGTRKLVAPFAGLFILNFILRRWDNLSSQFSDIYSQVTTEG